MASDSPASGETTVYVTGNNLRMHTGPRLGASMVDVLPLGMRLTLHGYHISWADVTTSTGERGYVLRTFVASTPVSVAPTSRGTAPTKTARQVHPHVSTVLAPPTAVSKLPEVRVTVALGVNLRHLANTTSKIIIAVPKNTVLLLHNNDATGRWSFVETQDHKATGWVYHSFLAPMKKKASAA